MEIVSDYCLMSSDQLFNCYHGENKLRWDDDDGFVLDWKIDWFWCLTPLSAIFQLYHGDQF